MRRKNDFKVSQDGEFWSFKHLDSGKTILRPRSFHARREVRYMQSGENLHVHRHELRRRSGERINEALL